MIDTLAPVRFEAHRGELVLGSTVVEAREAGRGGELRIGGPEGPVLRPVCFGERTRAAVRAATSPSARDVLCATLLRATIVADGAADPLVQQTVALWLAGAADAGPSFSDTLLCVARGAGWDPAQIAQAEAAEVDRLAAALGAVPTEPAWRRLLLVSATTDTLQGLRDEFADRLLARATGASDIPAARDDATDGARELTPAGRRLESTWQSPSPGRDEVPALRGASSTPPPGPRRWGAALARPTTVADVGPSAPSPVMAVAAFRAQAATHTTDARPPHAVATSAPSALPRTGGPAAASRLAARGAPSTPSIPAAAALARSATPPAAGLRAGSPRPADLAAVLPTLTRALGVASPAPLGAPTPLDDADLAEALATLLDDEADLRGLAR